MSLAPALLPTSGAEVVELGEGVTLEAEPESELLGELDGTLEPTVVDVDISVTDKDSGMGSVTDGFPGSVTVVDVPFSGPVIRRLLLLTGGAVLLAALEPVLPVLDSGNDTGETPVVVTLRPLDGDAEPELELGIAPIENGNGGFTDEGPVELVGGLEGLSADRYDGPLWPDDTGTLLPAG